MNGVCDGSSQHGSSHHICRVVRVVMDPAEGHKGRYQDGQRHRKSHGPRRRIFGRGVLGGKSEGVMTNQVKHDEDSETRRVR